MKTKTIDTVSNTSLLIEDEYIEGLKRLLTKFNLKKSLKNNIWEIPTGTIGQLNISDFTINVNPNIHYLNNFDYLKLLNLKSPDESENGELETKKVSKKFEDIFLSHFQEYLTKLIKEGIPRNYISQNIRTKFFKGIIDLPKTYISYRSQEQNFIHSMVEKLNVNYHEAIVIKAAYEKICSINRKYKKPFITSALNPIKRMRLQRIESKKYIKTKQKHNKTLIETYELAEIIINNLNSLSNKGTFSTSMLINSNTLFESFVSNLLIQKFPKERFELQYEKPAAYSSERIIVDKPDIMYFEPVKAIIDVKNKDFNKAITSENYHQMISYMNTFNVKTCVLVYPFDRDSNSKLFKINHDSTLKMYAVPLNIKSHNYESFTQEISSIIRFG